MKESSCWVGRFGLGGAVGALGYIWLSFDGQRWCVGLRSLCGWGGCGGDDEGVLYVGGSYLVLSYRFFFKHET